MTTPVQKNTVKPPFSCIYFPHSLQPSLFLPPDQPKLLQHNFLFFSKERPSPILTLPLYTHTYNSPDFAPQKPRAGVQQGPLPHTVRLRGETQLAKPDLFRRLAEGQAWKSSQVIKLCPVARAHGILPTSQSIVLADFHMADNKILK